MLWRTFHAGQPWVCPGCLREFQIRRSAPNVITFCAIGLALGVSYAFGVRGMWLLATTVALWVPALAICVFVADRISPPKLRPYQPKKRERPPNSAP